MINLVNWQQEEPTDCGGERQLSMDGTSRVSREAQARICERLGVRFPGATRPSGDLRFVNTAAFSGSNPALRSSDAARGGPNLRQRPRVCADWCSYIHPRLERFIPRDAPSQKQLRFGTDAPPEEQRLHPWVSQQSEVPTEDHVDQNRMGRLLLAARSSWQTRCFQARGIAVYSLPLSLMDLLPWSAKAGHRCYRNFDGQ